MTSHRQTLRALGIIVKVGPPDDYRVTVDVPADTPPLFEDDFQVEVSEEHIKAAKNGRDLMRLAVETALVKKLRN